MENKTFKFVFDQKTLHFLVQQARHYVQYHSAFQQYEILEVTQALSSGLRQLEEFRRATITVSIIANEVVVKFNDLSFEKGKFKISGGNLDLSLNRVSPNAFTPKEKSSIIKYLYDSAEDLCINPEKHVEDPNELYTFLFNLDDSSYTLLKQKCDEEGEYYQNILSAMDEEGKTNDYDLWKKRLDFSRDLALSSNYEYNVYEVDIQEKHQFFKNFLFIMEYCLL